MEPIIFQGAVAVPQHVTYDEKRVAPPFTPAPVAFSYDPFARESALFFTVAELVEATDFAGACVDFASRYGLLADDLSTWRDRASAMRGRVAAWQTGEHTDLFTVEGASVTFCPDRRNKRLTAVIADLWTCVRLQFNLAALQEWHFRNCLVCDKPFAVKPPVTRQTRRYCSVACSSKAYRARKGKGGTKKRGKTKKA